MRPTYPATFETRFYTRLGVRIFCRQKYSPAVLYHFLWKRFVSETWLKLYWSWKRVVTPEYSIPLVEILLAVSRSVVSHSWEWCSDNAESTSGTSHAKYSFEMVKCQVAQEVKNHRRHVGWSSAGCQVQTANKAFTIVRPNLLSASETLAAEWTAPHVILALGADVLSCLLLSIAYCALWTFSICWFFVVVVVANLSLWVISRD